MMSSTEAEMTEPDEAEGLISMAKIAASVLGILFCTGAAAGAIMVYVQIENSLSSREVAVTILLCLAVASALIWYAAKQFRKRRSTEEPLTKRERLNRNILLGCMLLGAGFGVFSALSSDIASRIDTADGFWGGFALGFSSVISDAPLNSGVAITLAAFWGLVLPLISIYWHKHAIDEQEEDAYRSGALFAISALWYVAPAWWLLWRGGILPAPNGFALYMMTIFIALIIWFGKKYR